MPRREPSALAALEAAAEAAKRSGYELHLVISGSGHHSNTALLNIRRFCDLFLPGRYKLRVTSLDRNPECAKSLEIFATPTLIREAPLPQRRFIGNMSRLEDLMLPIDQVQPMTKPDRTAEE